MEARERVRAQPEPQALERTIDIEAVLVRIEAMEDQLNRLLRRELAGERPREVVDPFADLPLADAEETKRPLRLIRRAARS